MRYIITKDAKQNRWYVVDTRDNSLVTLNRSTRERVGFNRWQAHTLALVCNSLENVR